MTMSAKYAGVDIQKAIQVLNWLKEELPQCFKRGDDKIPLKIGIHLDLLDYYKNDDRFNEDELDLALYFYTHSKRYLQLLVEGADRIDLTGKVVEKVSVVHEQYAKQILGKREKQAKNFQQIRELETEL